MEEVRTQEGVQFPIVAELRNEAGLLVDRETVVIPSQTGGFPAYIEQNGEEPFSIGNIHLPDGTSPRESLL